MIVAEQLRKHYGLKEALSGVSLQVRRGEVLGLIGPNGAGKSTAMKILSGVLPVYSGTVRIGSFDISEHPLRAKALTGYLPENAPLPPDLTVRAFLKYAARMQGVPVHRMHYALDKALDRCSLSGVASEEIESLSKGYRRRVSLAQALIHEPPVLLMDEPTDGLDPNQKREIRNLIQLIRPETAIIISTHILEEVRAVCSHVILLANGKVAFRGTTEDFVRAGERSSACAFRVAKDDIPLAAAIFRRACPGLARLEDSLFILPLNRLKGETEEEKTESIRSMLEAGGVRLTGAGPASSALDDIFAELTTPSALSAPDASGAKSGEKEVCSDD